MGGTTVLEPPVERTDAGPPPVRRGGGGGGGGGGRGRGGDGGDPDRRRDPGRIAILGMWVALVPIGMLFMAFVSAYVVRHGVGQSWTPGNVPGLLWVNTALLGASSVALETARARVRSGGTARGWTAGALFLGLAFVAGQVLAWFDLRARGIGISATPHASFFYLMTAAHALHVAGGLIALAAAAAYPPRGWRHASLEVVLHVTAIYWHFLLALWVVLFALLRFWR
jgi:cytochrome c oxidase subunit 3